MKIKFRLIHAFIYILIFYVLGEFAIELGRFVIPYYFGAGLLYLGFLLYKYNVQIIKCLKNLYRQKTGKFLLFFILWVFVSIVFSLPQGTFVFKSFITNFLGNFFNSILLPLILSFVTICIIRSYSKVKNIFFWIFLIILGLGIIEYFGIRYDILAVKKIFSTLVNRGSLIIDTEKAFFVAFQKPRISSLFREPGEYAGFLVVTSPLFFYFYQTKFKIVKNKIFDICLKSLLLILFILSLIFTQSPINLVFFGIISIPYILNCIKYLYLKYRKIFVYIVVSILFPILIFIIILFSKVDINESYLIRIATVLNNIKSINNLVIVESSLATRICVHEAQIRMGIDYPLFGVGYANMDSGWASYALNLPHNITPEVYHHAMENQQKGGSAFIWKIFAETGYLGVCFLYLFWFTLLYDAYKIASRSKEKEFILALANSCLVYVLFSFYLMLQPIFIVYAGLLLGIICNEKISIKNMENRQYEIS